MKSPALLFQWPHRHRIHLLLPAMLTLAAIAHAGIFFLFSAASPAIKPDGLRPARVYFLKEGSTDLAQLESLLASNDPALFAPLHSPLSHHESVAAYIPQYASARTALLNIPPRTTPLPRPSPIDGTVPIAKRRIGALPPSTSSTSTRLSSPSPELARRLPTLPEGLLQTNNNSLNSVSFFVGIQANGQVAHIVPSHSSGNPDEDLRWLQILKSLTFNPVEKLPLSWGVVEVHFESKQPFVPTL